MSNGVPPPSTKPVWPIVVACLVLVVGIAVAAVFVGMNLNDSDDNDVTSRDAPSYASNDAEPKQTSDSKASDGKQKKSNDDEQSTPDSDESEPPEKSKDDKSNEPSDDSSESVPAADDPRLDCGNASTVLTTRTAELGASICRSADGDYIYRGMSVNIDGSLVLHASLDNATDMWIASNGATEYTVDADTGQLTIRDTETGEVQRSEPSIEFRTN